MKNQMIQPIQETGIYLMSLTWGYVSLRYITQQGEEVFSLLQYKALLPLAQMNIMPRLNM